MRILRPNTIADNGGSFSRASVGTYFDADGILQTAGINEPRYDHDPATGAFKGLLLEEEGKNLLAYGNQFDDAKWKKFYVTVVETQVNFPGGMTTVFWLQEDTNTGSHAMYQLAIVAVGMVHALSVYARAGTRTRISLSGVKYLAWSVYPSGVFDLESGTVIASTGSAAADIKDMGNGVYRCTIFGIPALVNNCGLTIGLVASDTTTSYTGDGVSGLYVWAAQVEAGQKATSYIPSAATPAVRAADVFTGTLIANVSEDEHPTWDALTAYVAKNLVIRNHTVYECLVGNTGFDPEIYSATPAPKWLNRGADNLWSMFDHKVGSRTTNPEYIAITVKPGMFDSIAFLDLEATTIEVKINVPGEGLVYHETIDLIQKSVIVDAYTYFFEPIITKDSTVILGLPPYGAGIVSIILSNPGGTAAIGTLAFGMQADLGLTQYEPSIGITSHSKKTVDDFGVYSVVKRGFSKRMSCVFVLPNTQLDAVAATLAMYDSELLVWIGVDARYSSMIIYGFYKSFSITVPYLHRSKCSIEVEGLST